jgi:acyl carrier protein
VSGGSTVERVQTLAARTAGPGRTPADAGPETSLTDDGFWLDSVDLVELVVACEQEFGVEFDGESDLNPETLGTVRSLARLIDSKRAT